MKLTCLLFPLLFLSCTQKEVAHGDQAKSTEQNCFILNEGVNLDETPKPVRVPTCAEVLKNLPAHIGLLERSDYEPFDYDLERSETQQEEEKNYFESTEYQKKYADWIIALPEFNYVSLQDQYALAKNKCGYWIIEKTNGSLKPYFLGLTQNIYLPDFYRRDFNFIDGGVITLKAAVVNVTRLSRVPMLPKYEILRDRIEVRLKLDDIKRDTDQDGFNDLFETFVGLNPKSADTDGDGINDFKDPNPKYQAGKDQFTGMYEMLVDHGKAAHYSFVEILTNCDYFQRINPKNIKVLMYTTAEQAPIKEDVLDLFFPGKYSKMKTYKNYEKVYFTDFSDQSGHGTISAELIKGRWKFDKKYTLTFGM